MVQKILQIVFGTSHDREMKKIQPTVDKINQLEPAMEKLSDAELKQKSEEFRKRLKEGETVNDVLPEAFAVCREASRRVLGMRHYDVQLIGGLALHEGKISEICSFSQSSARVLGVCAKISKFNKRPKRKIKATKRFIFKR